MQLTSTRCLRHDYFSRDCHFYLDNPACSARMAGLYTDKGYFGMILAIGIVLALAYLYWQCYKTNMDVPRNAEKINDGENWDDSPVEQIVYTVSRYR